MPNKNKYFGTDVIYTKAVITGINTAFPLHVQRPTVCKLWNTSVNKTSLGRWVEPGARIDFVYNTKHLPF